MPPYWASVKLKHRSQWSGRAAYRVYLHARVPIGENTYKFEKKKLLPQDLKLRSTRWELNTLTSWPRLHLFLVSWNSSFCNMPYAEIQTAPFYLCRENISGPHPQFTCHNGPHGHVTARPCHAVVVPSIHLFSCGAQKHDASLAPRYVLVDARQMPPLQSPKRSLSY